MTRRAAKGKPGQRPLRCPCCNKPFTPEPVKVCMACHRPILRGHKYTIRGGKLQHRHCAYPDSYLTPTELDEKFGRGTWARMHPRAGR